MDNPDSPDSMSSDLLSSPRSNHRIHTHTQNHNNNNNNNTIGINTIKRRRLLPGNDNVIIINEISEDLNSVSNDEAERASDDCKANNNNDVAFVLMQQQQQQQQLEMEQEQEGVEHGVENGSANANTGDDLDDDVSYKI